MLTSLEKLKENYSELTAAKFYHTEASGSLNISWHPDREAYIVRNPGHFMLTIFENVEDIKHWLAREAEDPGILEELLTGRNWRKELKAERANKGLIPTKIPNLILDLSSLDEELSQST